MGGCTGPDGRPVDGEFALLADGTAVVELATASGLPLMARPDPLAATTRGTGELIAAALDHAATLPLGPTPGSSGPLLVGLGGSASSDGGAGLLSALGVRLLGADGLPLADGGGALTRLHRIALSRLRPAPPGGVRLLTDVTNPLLGPDGAGAVYGPQKGAGPEEIGTYGCTGNANRYSGQALSLTSGSGGVVTAPQRDWSDTGAAGNTHPVDAQTLTFPAGSANLIPGGDFESGALPGWTAHNAAVVGDAAAHSPTHDLQLKSPAGDYATMEYKVTGLRPATTYTYSGWVRADSGASTSFGVKNFGGPQVTTHTTATGWTPVSDTFTTGATSTSATVFCYLPSASATATCDDISLTVG
ncbi:glycerate kinase [Streptacidiphilus melanogenes]|uniref:glycerate kinase n=1 Tax=Streptacidiphilus melanogenes TaxID=411235 RepID=UPI000694039A|nr:glycerate kinase [Streptacidiphilus melanogenes]